LKNIEYDYLVCLESRGFIFGSAIGLKMQKGIVLVRKPNKLPGKVISKEFKKNYG
jgi:adenine phosphoribosyltransferase